MGKKIMPRKAASCFMIGILLIVLNLILCFPDAVYADNSEKDAVPNAKAAILYEATTGTVLYEKNADMQLAPASMTKIMTAILVLESNPEL